MTSLRDALAAALRTVPEATFLRWSVGAIDGKDADAILVDPGFRAALTKAIAEALVTEYDCCTTHDDIKGDEEHIATVTVSRMLGDDHV